MNIYFRWIHLAIVNLVLCIASLNATEPCNFNETVDLANSHKFPNGSYLYDNILIPSTLIGKYNYKYVMNNDSKISVPLHERGCLCLLKTCVPFCCGRNQTFRGGKCQDILNGSIASTHVLVSNEIIDVHEHFAYQQVTPCEAMLYYEPNIYSTDKWTLYKNGSFEMGNSLVEKHSFCLVKAITSINSTEYTIHAMGCLPTEQKDNNLIVKAYTLLFSLPFMLATIIIYLIVPELRTLHGKSFICYLVGLFFGYSIFCCIIFFIPYFSPFVCSFVGFTAYYCFMASFVWLNIISFDVWSGFRKINVFGRLNENKLFWIYFIFANGIAAILLIFCLVMQYSDSIPNAYKPGIVMHKCFLNLNEYVPAFLYFYGFIIIIIGLNTIFFVLTAIKIYKVQKEFDGVMTVTESNKNFKSEHTKFLLFLRLFIIMGVVWITEIICFLINRFETLHYMIYILEFLNAIQGFIIFILFIMKNKIKRLLRKRFSSYSPDSNKSSSTMTSLSLKRI